MIHKHTTTTGKDAVIVTIHYTIDEDGVELHHVFYMGSDILPALCEDQQDVLVDSCAYAYESWAAQEEADRIIEQHIQEQAA